MYNQRLGTRLSFQTTATQRTMHTQPTPLQKRLDKQCTLPLSPPKGAEKRKVAVFLPKFEQ